MSCSGRSSRIVLLDGTTWNFHIHTKLLGSDLLYTITSHLSLTETQYFALSYQRTPLNSANSKTPQHHHHHRDWLQLDKKVLEHDVAKQPGELVFHFQIKFYVDCVCSLFDILTVELFYQQARCLVSQEVLTFDTENTIELASYSLQEALGDYVNDQASKEAMKSLSLLTTNLLKTYPSITYCENQVIEKYKQLTGMSRGLALLRYIFLVERQPSYGQHYYDVKDKCGLPWLLGVGSKGLTLCDHNDPRNPRRSFAWSQLNNLHYKEKKFYVQLKDHKRSSTVATAIINSVPFSTARQRHPSTGSSSHGSSMTWVCHTPHQAKALWEMAVEQHQFATSQQQQHQGLALSHHGRQQWSSSKSYNDYSSKFISDLADDITCFGIAQPRRTSVLMKLSRDDVVGSSQSLSSRSSSQTSDSQSWEVGQMKPFSDKLEYMESLKHKRLILDELLKQKIDQYQSICIKESELTGNVCSDVTELLALSFSKTPQTTGLINGRVKTSMKGAAPSMTSVTSNSSNGEGSRLVPQRVGSMLLGTGFHLSHKHMLNNLINPNPSELDQLELELDLQTKIQSAALRLAQDGAIAKSIKKKRKKSFKEATRKLKELESKVMKLRKEEKMTGISNYPLNRSTQSFRDKVIRDVMYTRPVTSDPKMTSLSSLTSSSMTSSSIQSQETFSEATTTSSSNIKSSCSNVSSSSSSSSSSSVSLSLLSHKMTTSQSCQPIITGGYLPSSVYKTRTQYRSTTYPTIPALSIDPMSTGDEKWKIKEDISTNHSKPMKALSNNILLTPIKTRDFKSTLTSPIHTPVPYLPTNDEQDLDVTLTGSSSDTILNNSRINESFTSDTLKSSNCAPGSKFTQSTPLARLLLSPLPVHRESTLKRPDAEFDASDRTSSHATDRQFSIAPSKTKSYLSIYLHNSKPSSFRSDVDISQMNATSSLDSLSRSNLTVTLSNPTTLSSQTQLETPRSGLGGKGSSQLNLMIKMQQSKEKDPNEENFYDITSKRIIRYEAKDEFRSSIDNTTTKLPISSCVNVCPNKTINHPGTPIQLPIPEYMPHLNTNGKQFFNYPPPEVILSKNIIISPTGSKEQQFSYMEKLHKLRLGGMVSPVGLRKVDVSHY